MKNVVKDYIKNCSLCQKNKVISKKVKQLMTITSTHFGPFEKIFLDIIGLLNITL